MQAFSTLLCIGALLLVVGCSTLTPEGAKVRLTSNPEVVRGCEFRGNVTAASGWNPQMTGTLGPEQVETKLRNQAAERGGNVLFMVSSQSVFTSRGVAEAYRCLTP